MTEDRDAQEGYDPPQVEQIPTDAGPSVPAAGISPAPDGGVGPEWRPGDSSDES